MSKKVAMFKSAVSKNASGVVVCMSIIEIPVHSEGLRGISALPLPFGNDQGLFQFVYVFH